MEVDIEKTGYRDFAETATILGTAVTIASAINAGYPILTIAAGAATVYSGLEFVKQAIKSYK